MTTTPGRRRLLTAACAVAVAVALMMAVAGCGGDAPAPPGPTAPGHDGSEQLPDGSGPAAGGTPDASAAEALQRIYSWQPVSDADSGAGMRRAAPWLTGPLREATTRADNAGVRSPSQWQRWRDERAIITATTTITAAADPPGARTVTRQGLVNQQVSWPDGRTQQWALLTLRARLTRDDSDRWRVAELTPVDISSGDGTGQ